MNMSTESNTSALHAERLGTAERSTFKILLAVSICHLLNDTVQSLLPALYPLLRNNFRLDFGQVGLIAFTATFTSSLLQPLVGLYSDRHPKPYFLAVGMGITLTGLLTLAVSPTYAIVLIAAGLIGTGSAVFHPESSRVARMASGGQHGFAQSIFQVGGNAGSALGPLLAAFVLSKGQSNIAWFSILALIAMILLFAIASVNRAQQPFSSASTSPAQSTFTKRRFLRVKLRSQWAFSSSSCSRSSFISPV
jgi:FSR family fosmidomycin resistance protein-like MFS transporter